MQAMIIMFRLLLLIAISGMAVFVYPVQPAQACAPPGCMPAVFWPVFEDGGEPAQIPENLARVWIRYWGLSVSEAAVAGTRLRNGAQQAFALENTEGVIALPETQEGDEWVIEETHSCDNWAYPVSSQTRVRIGAAAPLPAVLGQLRVSGVRREEVQVADASGSCSSPIDAAVVEVSVDFAPEILPYRDLLRYDTLVDGATVWEAPGSIVRPYSEGETVRIFVPCQTPGEYQMLPDIGEGMHTIVRRAYLPTVADPVASNQVTVTISCDVTEPEKPGKKSSGCSVGGRLPLAPPHAVLAMFLLAVFRFRRRAAPKK